MAYINDRGLDDAFLPRHEAELPFAFDFELVTGSESHHLAKAVRDHSIAFDGGSKVRSVQVSLQSKATTAIEEARHEAYRPRPEKEKITGKS